MAIGIRQLSNVAVVFSCCVAASAALAQTEVQPGLFMPAAPRAQPVGCAANSEVTVGTSTICGVPDDLSPNVFVYKGIQYGDVKERWKDAVPKELPAKLEATEFKPICPQSLSAFAREMKIKMDEQCLFLNVWRPSDSKSRPKPLPVMLFIHGGAFMTGAGSDIPYDGGPLAARGAVVVTFNYRLGALGFLVGDRYGDPKDYAVGNYGLHDQQLAMQWVHDNIANFGGDPARVMLFGESAGAMSVALHTFDIPTSVDLFASALMESNVGGSVYRTSEQAKSLGNEFLNYLCIHYGPADEEKCKADTAWLSQIRTEDIVTAQQNVLKRPLNDMLSDLINGQTLPWGPVVDNSFITGEPYAGYAPNMTAKPLAFGVNKDEGAMFIGMLVGGIWKIKPNWHPSISTYRSFLSYKFKAIDKAADTITAANRKYNPRKLSGGPGYSRSGTALANVYTDYTFTCGDVAGVNAALDKGQSIFAYYFSQPVFFSLLRLEAGKGKPADNGACDPDQHLTCHATELPYVFNTVSLIPGYKPDSDSADKELAAAMNEAWFDFADNPTKPKGPWKQYERGGEAVQWHASGTGNKFSPIGPPVRIEAEASCKMWSQQPYGK